VDIKDEKTRKVFITIDGDDLVQMAKGHSLTLSKQFEDIDVCHSYQSVTFEFVISLKAVEQRQVEEDDE
jgi:hypothetical protein